MTHLNVHHQDGKTFYRSAGVINNDLPLGQRKNLQWQKWKRVNYCPKENYFTSSSSNNIAIINTALKELEDGASQLEVTPVKTSNAETQTEPLAHFPCQEIDDNDGLCFMTVKKMDNFIREIASHAKHSVEWRLYWLRERHIIVGPCCMNYEGAHVVAKILHLQTRR
jgi:hypothetical protein